MKIRNFLFTLAAFACLSPFTSCTQTPSCPSEDIVVLYDNDVHCAVDGYTLMKALKDSVSADHEFVFAVSSGDYAQGGSLGAVSHGGNIIKIMNEVGYDFVTLGNHEFDYGIERQQELIADLTATTLCCNFKDLRTGKVLYESYSLVDCGGATIAFVGMATPYSKTSSNPTYFKDENGNDIYSFSTEDFYKVAQKAVNKARRAGADYVVVLSHLGDESEGEGGINSPSMIENTYGIDVVLDGHSHSVIPGTLLKNKRGKDVILTSTGTKFQNIGMLTLTTDGVFTTELIDTKTIEAGDPEVEAVVQDIKDGYRKVSEQVICTSDVLLRAYNDKKERIVRNAESNLGNFCTDAYRTIMGTDIALLGGGSFRADLPKGDVTYNDLYTLFPFENGTCKVTLTGELLLDVLEFSVSINPDEFGGFLQVSGLRFEYTNSIPSGVKYDSAHGFAGVEGERKVKTVEILGADGQWEPLDPQKTYTCATSTYVARDCGDGYTMMSKVTELVDLGLLDTELILRYLDEVADRHIGEEYADIEGRIILLK